MNMLQTAKMHPVWFHLRKSMQIYISTSVDQQVVNTSKCMYAVRQGGPFMQQDSCCTQISSRFNNPMQNCWQLHGTEPQVTNARSTDSAFCRYNQAVILETSSFAMSAALHHCLRCTIACLEVGLGVLVGTCSCIKAPSVCLHISLC